MTLSHQANGWPTTGNYAYASDLGQNSIPGIIALCRSSGVPFTVGSTYRQEIGSWHFTHNACDIFATENDMNRLAAYLVQYAHFMGEVLHTPAWSKKMSNGRWSPVYAVDNGHVLNSLSDYTAREHRNHVHVAATNSGLLAAVKQTPALYKKWVTEMKKQGYEVPITPTTGPTPPSGSVPFPQSSVVDPNVGALQTVDTQPMGCLKQASMVMLALPPVAAILAHYL